MRILNFSCILLTVICLHLAPVSLQAGVISVTQTGDDGPGSLRQALRDAFPGDTISFSTSGSIELDSTLMVNKSLYLFGPGPEVLSLSGQGSKRILQVDSLVQVYIIGLAFEGGNALLDASDVYVGGGAIRNYGILEIDACIFSNNFAGYGGAIENAGVPGRYVELKVRNSTFIGNDANPPQDNPFLVPRAGGAIMSNTYFGGRSKVIATNCTFSGNKGGQAGGAIQLVQQQSDTTRSLVCYHCTITDNESDGAGGVDVGEFGLTYFVNTIIAGNRGRARNPNVFGNLHSLGGLLVGKIELNTSIGYVPGPGDLLNTDPKLSPLDNYGGLTPTHALQCNSPAIDGGVSSSVAEDQRGRPRTGMPDIGAVERDDVFDVQVTQKSDGGAGSLRAAVFNACPGDTLDLGGLTGTITLSTEILLDKNLSIFGNPNEVLWLSVTGPARIFAIDTGVTVHLLNLTLANGRPDINGGGAILNRGTLRVENSTFFNNSAISGGAVANYGDGGPAYLEATNCTFSGNKATLLDGGAIDNYEFTHSTSAVFRQCTFTKNVAEKRGGAIYNQADAEVRVHNTLTAGNQAREGDNLYGIIMSLGHNLFGDDQGYILSGGSADLQNRDPLLGPLQYHGGSSYTHALEAGSPAIDAGDNIGAPSTDQRGYPRIFNNVADIGAYEYDPATALDAELKQEAIQVFPNPNRGNFTVRLPGQAEGEIHLRVLDLQGRVVHQQACSTSECQVYARDLSPGIYVLQVQGSRAKAINKLIHIF